LNILSYESISRLPPAHTLLISQKRISIEKYWDLDPEYETYYSSDEEYVEAFHEIFTKSVSDRLRCNGQATSMLSGGNDSTYVVGTARQIMQDRGLGSLPVYSGVSQNDPHCRETSLLRSVIAQGGLESTTVKPGDILEYEREILALDSSLGEPFDYGMTMNKLFYLMARERGQRVMLDGVEGDLVHSLSRSYPASLFRYGHPVSAILESVNIWRNTFGKQKSLYAVFKQTIRPALIPDYLRRWRRYLMSKSQKMGITVDDLKGTLVNRDFARAVDIEARLAKEASYFTQWNHLSLREIHIENVLHPCLTVALERYDRVAAICTVEPRHPLLDKRLIEFSVSLPWQQKVGHGWSKYIIRRASEPLLPDDVVWRRGWPVASVWWAFTDALTQNRITWMKDQIREQQALLSQYVEPIILKNIINGSRLSLSEHGDSILNIFQLANWLKFNMQNEVCELE